MKLESLIPRAIGCPPGGIRTEFLGEDLIKGCLNCSCSSIISFGILAYGPANGDLEVLFSSFDSSFGFLSLVLSDGLKARIRVYKYYHLIGFLAYRSPGVVNLEADGEAKNAFLSTFC